MAQRSPSPEYIPPDSTEREQEWTLLDKRPEQSEIISYDPDEIAEVRRLTESELKLISSRRGTEAALNKETQAFLDAASVMRALSHVAEHRFEQGNLDGAAQTVIRAIRWQRLADGLYLSGGVTLPRTNSIRLWYLLAEIYIRMDERDLALKTMQKAAVSSSEFGNPPLSELLTQAESATQDESAPPPDRTDRSGMSRIPLPRSRRAALIIAIVLVGILAFTGFRAQVAAKSMIDHSSEGVDYLNIAFGPTGNANGHETLFLANNEFAALRGKLESWSWIITISSAIPPAHDQFVAMDRLADLGTNLVAARSNTGRLSDLGSIENICNSAERLSGFDGNLLSQLDKNRRQMLEQVPIATNGAC